MKNLLFIILLLFGSVVTSVAGEGATHVDLINDVHRIAEIIEEYKASQGEYPFAENWRNVEEGMKPVPIICYLSVHPLPGEFQYPPPGTSGYMMESSRLESYLSVVLKRKILLPKDRRPINVNGKNRPFFYQLQFNGEHYFVAVYLSEPIPQSRKINDDLYKYEVGSTAVPSKRIWKYDDIKRKK